MLIQIADVGEQVALRGLYPSQEEANDLLRLFGQGDGVRRHVIANQLRTFSATEYDLRASMRWMTSSRCPHLTS